jgi:hypothetical protein
MLPPLFGAASGLFAQTVVEGTVQLPKPAPDLGVNERYQVADQPIAPANPPAAVVYLVGDFSRIPIPVERRNAQMPQKNMTFAPDLVAAGRNHGRVPQSRRHVSQCFFLFENETLRSRALPQR